MINENCNFEQWDAVEAPKELNLSEVESLCDQIVKQRQKCEEVHNAYKEENKTLEALEFKLLETLQSAKKDKYASNHGTFTISERKSVRIPVGQEKAKFLDYLRREGLFDTMVSVNSQTLNGWYKKEFERAKEEGRIDSFNIPGLGEPAIQQIISFRKAQ